MSRREYRKKRDTALQHLAERNKKRVKPKADGNMGLRKLFLSETVTDEIRGQHTKFYPHENDIEDTWAVTAANVWSELKATVAGQRVFITTHDAQVSVSYGYPGTTARYTTHPIHLGYSDIPPIEFMVVYEAKYSDETGWLYYENMFTSEPRLGFTFNLISSLDAHLLREAETVVTADGAQAFSIKIWISERGGVSLIKEAYPLSRKRIPYQGSINILPVVKSRARV